MSSKSHEQLILGDALDVILAEEQRVTPVISEYQFEREVLGILENPFGEEALQRYSVYVGELTKPLNVVDNQDRHQVLFTVPALVQSPITTIAVGQGMTADTFMRTLSRDAELGGRNMNEKIRSFMMHMTRRPNYVHTVIYPIQHILARYGRRMVDLPGVQEAPIPHSQPSMAPSSSSFSDDEYDD